MIKADPQDKAAASFCSRGSPENAHLAKNVFLGGIKSSPETPLGTCVSSC